MPAGWVRAARLQRTGSENGNPAPCLRLSPDCHSRGTTFLQQQQQQQQTPLFGLYPRSPGTPTSSTPETPGSLSEPAEGLESTDAIQPYYNLAAAAAAAAATKKGEGLRAGLTPDSSSSSNESSADVASVAEHSKQQRQQQQQCKTEVQAAIIDAPRSSNSNTDGDDQHLQQPAAWREVIAFALPMLATLAADPLASLVDTAFVGHLGAAQLAGVGMAINIFSSITRLFNAPLLAVTTSTVAAAAAESERDSKAQETAAAAAAAALLPAARSETLDSELIASDEHPCTANVGESNDILVEVHSCDATPSVAATSAVRAQETAADGSPDELKEPLLGSSSSTGGSAGCERNKLSVAVSAAIVLALSFSFVEVVVLAGACNSLVSIWGAPMGSVLNTPTRQFLLLRGLAAPVTVLLLVMQGVFRGLQDAKTPFYATLACNALNIALEPPFIFKPLNLGVQGSALATALAQTLPLVALLVVLQRRYKLRFRGLDMKQLGAMFAPTGFLLLRTVSISAVFAAATSLVARAGPLAAAAHQVAYQIWMATSLLADSLAVASQTILARSVAAGDLKYARKVAATTISMALLLGCLLSVVLGVFLKSLPGLFTQDPVVLSLTQQLMPIVALTQPLNALAFVLDGVLYGAGGFKYASGVMLLCATPSLGLMFLGQILEGQPQQRQAGSNGLPYTVAGLSTKSAFSSSGSSVSGSLAKPYSGVLQPPTGQYSDTAAMPVSFTSLHSRKTQSLNELNRILQNVTAAGFYSDRISTFGVLSAISQVSVGEILQGFMTQSSTQGYNSLYSQQPTWTGPAVYSGSAFTAHRTSSQMVAALSSEVVPTAAAAALDSTPQDGSSSGGLAVLSHSPMPAAVYWVWAGMVMLMFMRAATILLPLVCRCYPFSCLYTDLKTLQQQQQGTSDVSQPGARQNSFLSVHSLSSVLAPARMWAWLGRGSFLAAGPAAAAAVERPPGNPSSNGLQHICSRKRADVGGLHEDAKRPLLAKMGDRNEVHSDEDDVLIHDDDLAELGSSYKLAAVGDEKSLLAAKSASVGIPIGKVSEAHTDYAAAVDESLLVVVCGDGSSNSGRSSLSSSSNSSSDCLSSTVEMQ